MLNFIKKMAGSSKKDSGCCGFEITEVTDETKDEKVESSSSSCCGSDSQKQDSCCE